MKKISLLLLIVVFWGCSSHKSNQIPKKFRKLKNLTVYPANTKPKYNISLIKDAVYGNTKKVLIGGITHFTVDDSGRVFIADFQSKFNIFSPNGKYLKLLGRNGKGPGEFEGISDIRIKLNRLYVYDSSLRRITIFSLYPLSLKNTISVLREGDSKTSSLDRFFISKNGNFFLGYPSSYRRNAKRYIQYYLLSHNGKKISGKLFEQKATIMPAKLVLAGIGNRTMIPVQVLFIRRPLSVLSSEDRIYSAWSEDFLIKVHNIKGKYLRAFYYPFTNVSFQRNKFIKRFSLKSRDIGHINFPKTWPALKSIKMDDKNRLWVSTIVKNMKVFQWWVLNPKGKLLARFSWPRSKPIQVIKNGYIYTKETNKKSGISHVVRYRITMKPFKKN